MDSSLPEKAPLKSDVTIVGIGASAGGLESIERLFRALPPDPGLAFVIVQHLSPDFRSVMDELMSRYTDLTVRRAVHRESIHSNHVYLLPPGHELEVQDGHLLLFDLGGIFELFAQAPQSIAREMRGLGLGLSISQTIITAHGGTLIANSAGKGRGATFTTTLPLDLSTRRAQKGGRKGHALRIVLVEDQDDSRAMLKFVLERRGHRVRTAADGPAGVQVIVDHRPDIALVDIGLPGADGYQVAHQVRHHLGGSVKLVALTGYGQPADIARSRESGFDRHVTKPLSPDKLELILLELMAPTNGR